MGNAYAKDNMLISLLKKKKTTNKLLQKIR